MEKGIEKVLIAEDEIKEITSEDACGHTKGVDCFYGRPYA